MLLKLILKKHTEKTMKYHPIETRIIKKLKRNSKKLQKLMRRFQTIKSDHNTINSVMINIKMLSKVAAVIMAAWILTIFSQTLVIFSAICSGSINNLVVQGQLLNEGMISLKMYRSV